MSFLWIYLLVGLLHVLAESIGLTEIKYATKVLLMPLLFLYLRQDLKTNYSTVGWAIFFSWLGDIFLMFTRQQLAENTQKLLFILGLVSFLIAHFFYILTFIKEINASKKVSAIVENPYRILPFVLFFVLLMRFLFPHLQSMKLPVFIYGLIICTMGVFALNRKNFVTDNSFWMVFVGAIIFIISDTTISVNVFYKPEICHRTFIMATYILAQAMIVAGWKKNQIIHFQKINEL